MNLVYSFFPDLISSPFQAILEYLLFKSDTEFTLDSFLLAFLIVL